MNPRFSPPEDWSVALFSAMNGLRQKNSIIALWASSFLTYISMTWEIYLVKEMDSINLPGPKAYDILVLLLCSSLFVMAENIIYLKWEYSISLAYWLSFPLNFLRLCLNEPWTLSFFGLLLLNITVRYFIISIVVAVFSRLRYYPNLQHTLIIAISICFFLLVFVFPNYYAELGVPDHASIKEIQKAVKDLLRLDKEYTRYNAKIYAMSQVLMSPEDRWYHDHGVIQLGKWLSDTAIAIFLVFWFIFINLLFCIQTLFSFNFGIRNHRTPTMERLQ